METKEYFEKVMQDFNQHRNGRSLRKYCQDEGIDYKWLQEYKRTYPKETKPVRNPEPDSQSFIPLVIEEEKSQPKSVWRYLTSGWRVLTVVSLTSTVIIWQPVEIQCLDSGQDNEPAEEDERGER